MLIQKFGEKSYFFLFFLLFLKIAARKTPKSEKAIRTVIKIVNAVLKVSATPMVIIMAI